MKTTAASSQISIPARPFDEFVTAQGGYGERVERPEDVPGALQRARDAVMKDRPPGFAECHHALLTHVLT